MPNQIYLAGDWTDGRAAATIDVASPATLQDMSDLLTVVLDWERTREP